jgi:hypothetical protein
VTVLRLDVTVEIRTLLSTIVDISRYGVVLGLLFSEVAGISLKTQAFRPPCRDCCDVTNERNLLQNLLRHSQLW